MAASCYPNSVYSKVIVDLRMACSSYCLKDQTCFAYILTTAVATGEVAVENSNYFLC